ncbi:MAG: NnrS family protein [Verrucomicrobia bacterium]|nr:NnrS family protein [Verrucomicrobiota bacterium]
MNFPACQHRKLKTTRTGGLRWLAAEPFRLFFASGILWSIVGVSLWPLFHAGRLGFYPGFVHSRLMIESFGGAFIIGFLGTAGPRMASAPKLTVPELLVLFGLHQLGGVMHLTLHHRAGDICFLALMVLLLLGLVVRVAKFRKDAPPPQMLLALTGLLCGVAGTVMLLQPATQVDARLLRLASLLLYQGLLLPPVLGIGSFIFPRILGGEFGEPAEGAQRHHSLVRAAVAAGLVIASFFLEAWGNVGTGHAIRMLAPLAYLLIEVKWHMPEGTLSKGLFWAFGSGLCGLALPAFFYAQRIGLEHLLYIGGFGLLILVVASRVLFGHSGDLDGFARKSWAARWLIILSMAAATTRASADIFPRIQISHHIHAAWLWGMAAVLWLLWHRRRFFQRDKE